MFFRPLSILSIGKRHLSVNGDMPGLDLDTETHLFYNILRSPKHFVFCLSDLAALSIHAGARRFYRWDGAVVK